MVFGCNARTLNKLYKIVKGSQTGYKKWLNEKLIPLADCNKGIIEVSPQQAYEIAVDTFQVYMERQRIANWQELEQYLLVKYGYSSTLTPQHLMKQEPPLICGAYKHGMNVARQCRWRR